MSENIADATHQILIRIQEQIASFQRSTEKRFDQIGARIDHVDEVVRKQRRDSAGMLVMMRATAGDFDERVREIEERMDAYDAGRM